MNTHQYLKISVTDLHRDRLQEQRQILHTVANQMQSGLESASAEIWLAAAAINQLHAYRLLTGNNDQIMSKL